MTSRRVCVWCRMHVVGLCPAHLQARAARLDLYWFVARGVLWGVLACLATIGAGKAGMMLRDALMPLVGP